MAFSLQHVYPLFFIVVALCVDDTLAGPLGLHSFDFSILNPSEGSTKLFHNLLISCFYLLQKLVFYILVPPNSSAEFAIRALHLWTLLAW